MKVPVLSGTRRRRVVLHGRLDQELDLANAMAIDEHLQSCTACKKIYDQHSTLRSAVRQYASYHAAPAGLADRIRARLDRTAVSAPAKTQRPRWQWFQFGRWFQLGAAMAATAAVTWTAVLQLNGPAQDELIAERVIAGRLDYLDNRPVAALVYRRDRHLINLFVWPDPKSDRTRPAQTWSKQGYHVLHWRDAGMTFWAISDLNPAEIKFFTETYARSLSDSVPTNS